MEKITIDLNYAIDTPAKDGTKELVFKRRMNGGDLAEAGFLFDMSDDGGAVSLSASQVNLIASRCCDLPIGCIEKLDGSDWIKVFKTVMGFFG